MTPKTSSTHATHQAAWGRNIFLSALFGACAVNGLFARFLDPTNSASGQFNWVAFLAIVLLLRGVALSQAETVRRRDIVAACVVAPFLLWPQGDASWLGMTMLALYLVMTERRGSRLWANGMIALAVTIPLLWARFVPLLFSGALEQIDVQAVSLLTGVRPIGNHLDFPTDPGGVSVGWACTSFANGSYVFLLWTTLTRTMRPMPISGEIPNLVAALLFTFAVNTVRLVLISKSLALFHLLHEPPGSNWIEFFLLAGVTAICLLGLRRELAA